MGECIVTLAIFNGQFINKDEITISPTDRGYQFGDGIYEVVGVYEGVPFKMHEHLVRLEQSAAKLRIDLPYSIAEFTDMLLTLKEKNNLQNGCIYLQVTRGIAERIHKFPTPTPEPVVIAYTFAEERLSNEVYEQGIDVILTEDIRWHRCDIKTLNLLPNALARQEAAEKDAFEAIFYRQNNVITEASSSNVFVVKDGVVFTHPANEYILNGITRQTVIGICHELGINVMEMPFTVEFLYEADEIFLTSTYEDVMPVKKVIGEITKEYERGKITKQLIEQMNNLIF